MPGHRQVGWAHAFYLVMFIWGCPSTSNARCGFRDPSSYLTPGRRDAYLSSTTHLPGSDLRHSITGVDTCHPEDIHKTEVESTIKLG